MDSLIDKFITGGGPLVAFVVVVYFMVNAFLKHMANQAELNRQMHREMHNDNLTSKRESQQALEKLSDSVNKNTDATLRFSLVVDKYANNP